MTVNLEWVYRHLLAGGYALLIVWTVVLVAGCAAVFGRELWAHPGAQATDPRK